MTDALLGHVLGSGRSAIAKVRVSMDVPSGRGLVLTQDVAPGELILRVPPAALVNPRRLAKGDAAALAPPFLSTHQCIALYLALWHAAARDHAVLSRHNAFLASLPRDFDTVPLACAESEEQATALLDALPTAAARYAARVRERFQQDWGRVSAAQEKHADAVAALWRQNAIDAGVALRRFGKADFLWAWLCTNSRCVYQKMHYASHSDDFTLAPLLDMANHSASPRLESKVQYDARDGLELRAPRSPGGTAGLRCGDEVCITYGPHSNAMLLAEYGFVLPRDVRAAAEWDAADGASHETAWRGNRYCGIDVDDEVAQLFAEQGAVGMWKIDLMESAAYWGDFTMHPEPAPAHPSHRLHLALRLLCMYIEEPRVPSRKRRKHAALSGCTGPPEQHAPDPMEAYSKAEAERVWLQLTSGQRERVSAKNEMDVRCTAAQLADQVLRASRERSRKLDAVTLPAKWQSSRAMVQQLLDEESTMAELLRESADRGDVW